MAKRLSSSNRRRGRQAKREVGADYPGDILRSEIDAAVATGFEGANPAASPERPPIDSAAQREDAVIETPAAPGVEPQVDATVGPSTLNDQSSPPVAPASLTQPPVAPKTRDDESTTCHAEAERRRINHQLSAEPLPARMLNEFVYCPRLFYYEFVEGVFVHNADTIRGATIHKKVDSGSGALPDAEVQSSTNNSLPPVTPKGGEGGSTSLDTIHSRSISMGSDRLGVTAKIDLVETRAAEPGADSAEPDLFSKREVCPVDYKVGAPREGEAGKELWDADKMQLGLQCLLLRDNGYVCREGIIYYRATKQRVRLEMTPELETWIIQKIEEARQCAAGPIPPPLFDSPKCPRCSLVTVCLPDETRMMAHDPPTSSSQSPVTGHQSRVSAPPRRLIATRDESRALYLNTPGLFVGRSGEVLQVKEKKELIQQVRINDVSHVALFGNIQISTAAVQALCEADIPITYFSMGGWFYGFTRGHSLKNVFTRVEQFRLARDAGACLWLARSFVLGKIRNQRTMLMRNHLEPPPPILAKLKNSAETALKAQSLEKLLGIEGAAAAFYFQQFNGMIKVEDELAESQPSTINHQLSFNFDFSGRKRRPPTDPVNALLSLAYSLLAKDCTIAALSVGFDPYVGFYHQPRFGRPALALDLMEEFRPLIAESSVLTAINNRMITEKDFVRAGKSVNLSAAGRKQFFAAYEARMNHLIAHPIFEYKITYRRALELQFRILARYLTGEIDEYVPFMTR